MPFRKKITIARYDRWPIDAPNPSHIAVAFQIDIETQAGQRKGGVGMPVFVPIEQAAGKTPAQICDIAWTTGKEKLERAIKAVEDRDEIVGTEYVPKG